MDIFLQENNLQLLVFLQEHAKHFTYNQWFRGVISGSCALSPQLSACRSVQAFSSKAGGRVNGLQAP